MKNTPVTPDVDPRDAVFKQFLRDIEAASLFGISRTTFRKLVREGLFPPPIKFGNCARWERDALLDAAASLQRRGLIAGGPTND